MLQLETKCTSSSGSFIQIVSHLKDDLQQQSQFIRSFDFIACGEYSVDLLRKISNQVLHRELEFERFQDFFQVRDLRQLNSKLLGGIQGSDIAIFAEEMLDGIFLRGLMIISLATDGWNVQYQEERKKSISSKEKQENRRFCVRFPLEREKKRTT